MTESDAIAKFKKELPDWWFTIGECSLTCDASCGPDRKGLDKKLLKFKKFDEGFHADLRQPSTMAEALINVLRQAKRAKKLAKGGKGLKTWERYSITRLAAGI